MAMNQRHAVQTELWNVFNDFMAERGFHVLPHDDYYTGRGSVASKDDRFAPIFNLHVWGGEIADNFLSILIEDRNGCAILDGETVAIYSMPDTGDREKNLLIFSKMVNDAYDRYGGYSKANRLDFVFNELKQDRRIYDDKVLSKSVDELINGATALSKKTGRDSAVVDLSVEKE